MADSESPLRDGVLDLSLLPSASHEIQYLLTAERQLLQSISGRAPIADVLRRICQALDSQLGGMFSVISLPGDNAAAIGIVASSAALFRLHRFVSAAIVDDAGQPLGSLEMFSTLARRPHLSEIQLIERAICLAAVAIRRHNQAANSLGELPPPGPALTP